jgi:FkbM family methyltransferase
MKEDRIFYRFIRLIYIFFRFGRSVRKAFLVELYSFLLLVLQFFQKKVGLSPVFVSQDLAYVITWDGIKMFFKTSKGNTGVGQSLEFLSTKKTREELLVSMLAKNAEVYVDVGANNGYYYSLKLANQYPELQIMCFEPNPEIMLCLKKNIELNNINTISLHEVALSKENGISFLRAGMGASGYLVNSDMSGAIPIVIKTLDSVIDHNLKVGLIKVDIEGLELDFLLGAIVTLKRCKPFLIMEFDEKLLHSNGLTSRKEVTLFLQNIDYKFIELHLSRDILCYHKSREKELVAFKALACTESF